MSASSSDSSGGARTSSASGPPSPSLPGAGRSAASPGSGLRSSVARGSGGPPAASPDARSYGSGARILSIGIAATGLLTFAFFSIASHVLGTDAAERVDVLWSAMFVVISVIYRPVEQLLSRTIAERRARGHTEHPLRVPIAIQASFALIFLILALAFREELLSEVFDHYAALYDVLVVGTLAYAGSYFARGWLAGNEYFALYGALVLMEATSRICFALAVALGIASGQTAIALGVAAAPLLSLVVVPAAFARRSHERHDAVLAGETAAAVSAARRGARKEWAEDLAPGERAGGLAPGERAGELARGEGAGELAPGQRVGELAPGQRVGEFAPFTADEADAALAGPGTEGVQETAAHGELSLRRGGRFALWVSGIMLSEQTLLNAAVLTVYATSDQALAGIVFNVMLIARAPLQLFQAIQTSLLPHLTGLEAKEGHAAFARAIRLTVLAIAAFAAAVALGLLLIGPLVMGHVLFGQPYTYNRFGLALIGLGMGMHLTSGALNQAALARNRARAAATCWLVAAVVFLAWMLTPLIGEQVLRAELGYLGATSLLALLLALLYGRGRIAQSS